MYVHMHMVIKWTQRTENRSAVLLAVCCWLW